MTRAEMAGSEAAERRAVLACLAQATTEELERARASWPEDLAVETVRPPEVGLVMLRGRIGGGGAPFNLGEATVTRAAVRLRTGEVGLANILGADPGRARLAAIFDALATAPQHADRVRETLLAPVAARLAAEERTVRRRTAATRVDFFTLVRGED